MALTFGDWAVMGLYGLVVVVVGVALSRRAGKNTQEFFLGGRSLPWWLLGTSMVATTFAADTPLAITEMVRTDGVWGNWFWWTWAVGHTLAVFLFARLWRRAEVVTDAELTELRYSGRPAAILRGVKAGMMAFVFNLLVLGWVTQAMVTILKECMNIPEIWALIVCGVLAVMYATSAGFWGVVVTDLLQFVLAMVGSIAFAVLAAWRTGGLHALIERAESAKPGVTRLVPQLAFGDPQSTKFFILVVVGWWATHNADAGGYMMQRLSSAKDEKHAVGGAMWFAIAHYALRAWPWIIVALASVTLLPVESFASHKAAYPRLIGLVLPVGLRGLMVACLLAAFMSTVDTHLNWGASYLVFDLYKRFWKKRADESHYVKVARLASVLLGVLASLVALGVDSIKGAWALLYSMGAGLGPFLILRWFWWRINAWTELTALTLSVITGVVLALLGVGYEYRLLVVTGVSLLGGGLVTLLTSPAKEEKLDAFYQKVAPGGAWGPFSCRVASEKSVVLKKATFLDLILGVLCVYGATLGVGKLLFGELVQAGILLGVFGVSGFCLKVRYDGGHGTGKKRNETNAC